MSRWSPVYVPAIETGRHVKNNACTVEIKIKWMIRKHMTYENTYRDDNCDKKIFVMFNSHLTRQNRSLVSKITKKKPIIIGVSNTYSRSCDKSFPLKIRR